MVLVTGGDHVAQLIVAANAVLPTGRKAYRPDQISKMAKPPAAYVEIKVERRYMPEPRMSPGSQLHGWRATVTWVADSLNNADQLEARTTQALEGLAIPLAGYAATPLVHELSEGTEQDDDGTWSGFVEFTYTAAPI